MVHHMATVAFKGVEVQVVDVQVQLAPGQPSFTIVGLGDKAIAESKERVRAALHSMGMALPPKRLTINLAPANLLKEGTHYDLPIAIAIMQALGVLDAEACDQAIALGELGLDGAVLPVRGVLPAAMHALSQEKALICAHANGAEAAWAGNGLEVIAASGLMALVQHLKGEQNIAAQEVRPLPRPRPKRDLAEVKGQHMARRALEIAAAGRHNLLMVGPPGSGKSLMAECLAGILPPMTSQEMLEYAMIASVAGVLPNGNISPHRPFRAPHHSASMPAIIGGGKQAKPGEISLSHHGVLFLDELPEFSRQVLEALRQPLESREISVSRVQHHVTYPADMQLVAAMNPCKCGYLGDADKECRKAPVCAGDYQQKISGPLLDRFDMVMAVAPVETTDMLAMEEGEPSDVVQKRVELAVERQYARSRNILGEIKQNAQLTGKQLEQMIVLDEMSQALLERATRKLGLSMRGYHRVLRVARTIADLAGEAHVAQSHIAEALGFRSNAQLQQQAA